MNPLYVSAFGLAGGLAGFFIHGWIERHDARKSTVERALAVVASAIVPALLSVKYQASTGFSTAYSILALILIGTSVFDLRKQVIPHSVTLPGLAAGLATSTWILPIGFKDALLGAMLGAGILLFTAVVEAIRGKEVGGGDWKLAAVIGSFLGTQRLITAMFCAGVLGVVAGVILVLRQSASKPAALGPYLSVGAIAGMLLG